MVKQGWFAKGPDFEWDLKSSSPTIVKPNKMAAIMYLYTVDSKPELGKQTERFLVLRRKISKPIEKKIAPRLGC